MESKSLQVYHTSTHYKGLGGWIFRTVLLAILASTLLATTGYTSPTPLMPEHPGLGLRSTTLDHVYPISVPGHKYYTSYHHNVRTAPDETTPEDEQQRHPNQVVQPRYLDSRGASSSAVDKVMDRVVRKFYKGFFLVGFAYVAPIIGEASQKFVLRDIDSLILPGLNLESKGSVFYLLPRLGLEGQNPNNYWSCQIYALIQEDEENPPMSYDELVLVPSPSTDDAGSLLQYRPPTHPSSNDASIHFYGHPKNKKITVIEVPKRVEQWLLSAQCYRTATIIQTKADWDELIPEIKGWPKGRTM
ncbi:uncharacterized protein C8R40DRAFT_194701 [Lentinula edodes]|uniref:uncharacterized protein n=1 Tax=Lentinula edodes TaxID=5353 RepID=UPI001E8ED67D|nr:uncharacterized protein C8R40DRAFT_194701 [Lentinula edodes]KAH7875760.1 hypothetical protein C8R40DRAFT_194701 [Lentinula edodes]